MSNSTTIFYNESIHDFKNISWKIPEGCNETTDIIIRNGTNIICYHQVKPETIITPVAPYIIIITAILSFAIGYFIFKYLKSKYGKQ